MKRNIAISKPEMGNEEWQAVKDPIFNGWVTSGPKVKEFEKICGNTQCKIRYCCHKRNNSTTPCTCFFKYQ